MKENKNTNKCHDTDIQIHLKRLTLMLQYIANMHQSIDTSNNSSNAQDYYSFLRECTDIDDAYNYLSNAFFQSKQSNISQTSCTLFSTFDFRFPSDILNIDGTQMDSILFPTPPFSFYKSSSSFSRKANTNILNYDGRPCWLRLTRLGLLGNTNTNDSQFLNQSDFLHPPNIISQAVRDYLIEWMNDIPDDRNKNKNIKRKMKDSTNTSNTIKEFLTLERMKKAPTPTTNINDRNEIKSFLRQYKKYLKRQIVRSSLEPIYNRLFEWLQRNGGNNNANNYYDNDEELVWGFGNAQMIQHKDKTSNCLVINGPILEVLVEVELANDGALLIRPREHTGVTLNREVVMALVKATHSNESSQRFHETTFDSTRASSSNETSSNLLLSNLYRSVSEMETSQLSPGEPSKYSKLLKQMAVKLSSGGIFQSSSSSSSSMNDNNTMNIHLENSNQLILSDAWCLYSRKKPRTVWAKDASALAEQVLSLLNDKSDHTLYHEHIFTKSGLPKASWVFTHGPAALDSLHQFKDKTTSTFITSQTLFNVFHFVKTSLLRNHTQTKSKNKQTRPMFPLPTSEAQIRIAELLLKENYPAIVCEGPPGTGKTHTIANILSAYLCQGKRVLITSKGAPALSVLRQRLPSSVQELCVDVSTSETNGMRQLQKTVERLANRVSRVTTEIEDEKCIFIQKNIHDLEHDLKKMDETLELHSDKKRQFFKSSLGETFIEISYRLNKDVPWLIKTTFDWTIDQFKLFMKRVDSLILDENDPLRDVEGSFFTTLRFDILHHVATNAGETLSHLKTTSSKVLASIPVFGSISGFTQNQIQNINEMKSIRILDKTPQTKSEWNIVLRALKHFMQITSLQQEVLEIFISEHSWPIEAIYENSSKRHIKKSFLHHLNQLLVMKEIISSENLNQEILYSNKCTQLDKRRTKIASQLQYLAEDLVEVTVVSELSRMFSAEAQSALIRFAQVAGKARFGKASQSSKISQRQKRHRQEYLDAFDKCVRYIPCWVLTSSQISDYLPPELGLFDLVVIDEASQSDITALPAMLRGKQWLIVGDGKQVSPTESFVSEAQINSLKAALPESPLEDSLLPGHSFFDLCSQAFPRGRVVLKEHFRCAPEIIQFSNDQFYDSQLVPLRLPTSSERMSPSLIDIRVKDGFKSGKINEKECDVIISMVKEIIQSPNTRSIGIISLIGNDQSRLVRSRLLNAIGPQKYKEHDILVGDAPTFQGAERDIIFLSMVCSPGSVPTQSQLMHAQRANVALSRARDRMILVRSIDCNHIASNEDIKIPILQFFDEAKTKEKDTTNISVAHGTRSSILFSLRTHLEILIEKKLKSKGFSVRRMGVVWNDALAVENESSGLRAALCIVCAGESKHEWKHMLTQQKSIERVGWNCFRVDALSLLVDFTSCFQSILQFLASSKVEPSSKPNDMNIDDQDTLKVENDTNAIAENKIEEAIVENNVDQGSESDSESEMILVSDDEIKSNIPDPCKSNDFSHNEKLENESNLDVYSPEQFGDVADLGFLGNKHKTNTTNSSKKSYDIFNIPLHSTTNTETEAINIDSNDANIEDSMISPQSKTSFSRGYGLKRRSRSRQSVKPIDIDDVFDFEEPAKGSEDNNDIPEMSSNPKIHRSTNRVPTHYSKISSKTNQASKAKFNYPTEVASNLTVNDSGTISVSNKDQTDGSLRSSPVYSSMKEYSTHQQRSRPTQSFDSIPSDAIVKHSKHKQRNIHDFQSRSNSALDISSSILEDNASSKGPFAIAQKSTFGQSADLPRIEDGSYQRSMQNTRNRKRGHNYSDMHMEDLSGEEYSSSDTRSQLSSRKRRKYRKLDKYSRDGRWYPRKNKTVDYDKEGSDWYDTDSDLCGKEDNNDTLQRID